jgi:hypothetical protein
MPIARKREAGMKNSQCNNSAEDHWAFKDHEGYFVTCDSSLKSALQLDNAIDRSDENKGSSEPKS